MIASNNSVAIDVCSLSCSNKTSAVCSLEKLNNGTFRNNKDAYHNYVTPDVWFLSGVIKTEECF